MRITETEQTHNNEAISLTSKQQYQLIIEKFPLVKVLKDKLKLEIDY